jgi:hypothetical protein
MTILSRNATVKVGTVTVADMATVTLNRSMEVIQEYILGSNYQKTFGTMPMVWGYDVEGVYDPTDTTGQTVLENAAISGTLLDIRVYRDATNYWGPNTGLDANSGCYVTAAPITVGGGGAGRISFTIAGTGAATWATVSG